MKLNLKLRGKINTEIKSEFESMNVNQTIHKMYLNLETSINILTPIVVFGRDIDSKVLLTEAIIVGEVPETYYNLEGVSRDEATSVLD